MPRLIDADALDDRLREEYLSASDVSMMLTPHGSIIFNAVLDRVRCIAISQPVIDAEPVRRGWWENHPGGRTVCSWCKEYPLYDYNGRQKFSVICPNCGAKMDAKEE